MKLRLHKKLGKNKNVLMEKKMKNKTVIVCICIVVIATLIFTGYKIYTKINSNSEDENIYQGEWIEFPPGGLNPVIKKYFGTKQSKTITYACIEEIIELNELGKTNIEVTFIGKKETIKAFTKEEFIKIYNVIKDLKGSRYNIDATEYDSKGIICKIEIVECDK